MNVLIIAPHPDDEVLGMGGTIKKLSKKNNIILCVVSEGVTAQYSGKNAVEERKKFCQECSSILGISKIFFLDFPDMKLNNFHLDINKKLEEIIKKIKPSIVYTSSNNDLNLDHSAVFDSTLVTCRPKSGVKKIQCLRQELPGNPENGFPRGGGFLKSLTDPLGIWILAQKDESGVKKYNVYDRNSRV